MGCGASKNKIHVATTANKVDNSKVTSKDNGRPSSTTKSVRAKSSGSNRSRRVWGSRDSLGVAESRGGSATSKFSKHSMDSGFNDNDEGNRFISEDSDPNLVRGIVDDFHTPRGLGRCHPMHTFVSIL